MVIFSIWFLEHFCEESIVITTLYIEITKAVRATFPWWQYRHFLGDNILGMSCLILFQNHNILKSFNVFPKYWPFPRQLVKQTATDFILRLYWSKNLAYFWYYKKLSSSLRLALYNLSNVIAKTKNHSLIITQPRNALIVCHLF